MDQGITNNQSTITKRRLIWNLKFGIFLFFVSWCLIIAPNEVNAGTIIKAPAYLGLQNGLVGHWTFDGTDIYGNSARDKSGNNNHGSLEAVSSPTGPSKAIGKLGQTLDFNGIDQYVSIPQSSTLNNIPVRTISVWIKPDSFGENRIGNIINKSLFAGGLVGWGLAVCDNVGSDCGVVSNTINFGHAFSGVAGLWYSEDANIKLGAWNHVVVIYDRSNASNEPIFYVNGVLKGTTELDGASGSASSDATQNVTIGALDGDFFDSAFDGLIDDVRIYSRALSATEIQRIYSIGSGSKANRSNTTSSLQKGLVGHWTFDGSYTNVPDYSGNSNIGTIGGTTKKVLGKIGQGLEFGYNNDTNYVNAGSATSVDNISLISTCAWIYPKSYSQVDNDGTIISKMTSGGVNGWMVMIGDDGAGNTIYFYNARYVPVGAWYIPSSSFRLNEWSYICFTYDSSSTSNDPVAYVNGRSVTVTEYATPQNSQGSDASQPLYIGNIPAGSFTSSFDGVLDEVRLYNRLLSSAEILRLYNQTQSQLNVSQSNLFNKNMGAYWTFDAKDIGTNGTIAKETTGNGRFGTITGARPVIGKIGQALEFDGVDDNVAIVDGNPLNFQAAGGYSISLWLKADDFEEWNAPFFINLGPFESGNDGLYLYAHTTSDATWGPVTAGLSAGVVTDSQAARTIRSSNDNVLTLGRWHHVVATYNGSLSQVNRINIYVDGINVTDTSDNETVGTIANDSSTGTYIGRTFWGGEFFDGIIDDVRMYERLLSSEEINLLYNLGR